MPDAETPEARSPDPLDPEAGPHRFRAVFISDIHLGTRGCQAERLLGFLRAAEADTLYLAGDVIDFWSMRHRHHWPQSHNDVVQKLLRKARKGTRVILVPGNHDDMLRGYLGMEFGGVLIRADHVHETADGRRLLVIHGDRFDTVVARAPWLAHLGTRANAVSQRVNEVFNWVRRRLGYPYWSLSGYLKHRVKHAGDFMPRFEEALLREARLRGVDGVVCGHVHRPEARNIDGVAYYNLGDWVDSCTALVEHRDGRLQLLHWPETAGDGDGSREPVPEAPDPAAAAKVVDLASLRAGRRGRGTAGAPPSGPP